MPAFFVSAQGALSSPTQPWNIRGFFFAREPAPVRCSGAQSKCGKRAIERLLFLETQRTRGETDAENEPASRERCGLLMIE
jgi:hypothetical protein